MTYNVKYTDNTKLPISIPEGQVDTSLDLVLFGRVDLEYGQQVNEDMLHLMERFSCPQDPSSSIGNTFPNYTTNGDSLLHPTQGQLWFNSSVKKIFVWNGTKWESIRNQGDVAANWGQIYDGNQIPRPVDPATGYIYPYSQCIWAVAPASFPEAFTYMICTTDNNALVTSKYRAYGDNALSSNVANYLIIAIADNVNTGTISVTPGLPYASSTPTVTPTISTTPIVSPTSTLSPTPTPAVTHTSTPVASPTPAASHTPAVTHTRTVTPTPTKTPPASLTPTPTPFLNSCSTCIADGFNCCVAVNSFLPEGNLAGEIKVGDSMILADQDTLEPGVGIVTYSEPSLQESVKIITESGASLVCSLTAPIPTTDGIILAPNTLGKFVGTMSNDIASWSKVISVEFVGQKWVQHITVGDKCFWAGENSASFILHHNIKCCYCGGVSNCSWIGPNCCEGFGCA